MTNYRLTPASRDGLLEIWKYTIKAWGSKKAKQYLFDIETKLELVVGNPEIGRARPEINRNYFSCPASQHMIYYLKAESHIQIIAILHQRMDIVKRLQN